MSRMEHGGNLKEAMAHYGGNHVDWIDLSTGINPVPYPIKDLSSRAWGALPDPVDLARLHDAARGFWHVPETMGILAVAGASSAIAHLPLLIRAFHPDAQSVDILERSYNEYQNAFDAAGFEMVDQNGDVIVRVHPDNPTGMIHPAEERAGIIKIIDESFCDVCPEQSSLSTDHQGTTLVIKSFGKFWGLAGVRLGFLIAPHAWIAQLERWLGPWAVSGPALEIAAGALQDHAWANETRVRLRQDAARLDEIMNTRDARCVGGTDLFRLYQVKDARAWQDRLAASHIWTRVFSYDPSWIRMGVPHPDAFERLEAAL